MLIIYNSNPYGYRVGDCVVRAISKALNVPWGSAYIGLCIQGYIMGDLPSSNRVWGAYLKRHGFKRYSLKENDYYTIEDFGKENPKGTYVVGTGTHAVAVCDGNIYDTWQSSQEEPLYYYGKEE